MKKSLRILAVALAAVLLMSGTAFAAGENPVITPVDSNTAAAFQEGYEKLDVTYRNDAIVAGGLYMVFVVMADGDGNYIPTESSVLYINQTVASDNGTVTFSGVYPTVIADSAIMISGTGLSGPKTVAYIEIPYTLGDVNDDGYINAGDALMVLRHSAGIKTLTESELLAANVNGDQYINAADALDILRHSAGLIGSFTPVN